MKIYKIKIILIVAFIINACGSQNSLNTQSKMDSGCSNPNTQSAAAKTAAGGAVMVKNIQVESAGMNGIALAQIALPSKKTIDTHNIAFYTTNTTTGNKFLTFSGSDQLSLSPAVNFSDYVVIFGKGIIRVFPTDTADEVMKDYKKSENIAIAQSMADLKFSNAGTFGINGNIPFPSQGNFTMTIYITDQISVYDYYYNKTDRSIPFDQYYKDFSSLYLPQALNNGYQFGLYSFIKDINISSFCGGNSKLAVNLALNDNVFVKKQADPITIQPANLVYQIAYVDQYLDNAGNIAKTGRLPLLIPSSFNTGGSASTLIANQTGTNNFHDFYILSYSKTGDKINWPILFNNNVKQKIPTYIKYDDKGNELAIQNAKWDIVSNNSIDQKRKDGTIWNSVGFVDLYWLNVSTEYSPCDNVYSVWDIGIKESDMNKSFNGVKALGNFYKLINGNYLYTNSTTVAGAPELDSVYVANLFNDSSKLDLISGVNDLSIIDPNDANKANYFPINPYGFTDFNIVSEYKRQDSPGMSISRITNQNNLGYTTLYTRKLNCKNPLIDLNAINGIVPTSSNVTFSQSGDQFLFKANGPSIKNLAIQANFNLKIFLHNVGDGSGCSAETPASEIGLGNRIFLYPNINSVVVPINTTSRPVNSCIIEFYNPYSSVQRKIVSK